jgi:hypothetical protein
VCSTIGSSIRTAIGTSRITMGFWIFVRHGSTSVVGPVGVWDNAPETRFRAADPSPTREVYRNSTLV